jgi:hypothetical protein
MLNLFVMMKYKLSLHHITQYCGNSNYSVSGIRSFSVHKWNRTTQREEFHILDPLLYFNPKQYHITHCDHTFCCCSQLYIYNLIGINMVCYYITLSNFLCVCVCVCVLILSVLKIYHSYITSNFHSIKIFCNFWLTSNISHIICRSIHKLSA